MIRLSVMVMMSLVMSQPCGQLGASTAQLFLTATQEETNMATELLLKVADCSHRLHFTVKWLQVVVCQKSQVTVKGSRLLSVGYSALVMHLGTALSGEKDCKRLEKAVNVRMNY